MPSYSQRDRQWCSGGILLPRNKTLPGTRILLAGWSSPSVLVCSFLGSQIIGVLEDNWKTWPWNNPWFIWSGQWCRIRSICIASHPLLEVKQTSAHCRQPMLHCPPPFGNKTSPADIEPVQEEALFKPAVLKIFWVLPTMENIDLGFPSSPAYN